MVYTQAPGNDLLRLGFLETLVTESQADQEAGNVVLSGALINRAVRLRDDMTESVSLQKAAFVARMETVNARDIHLAALRVSVRHAWRGVFFRLKQEGRPELATRYYKLPFQRRIPRIDRIVELVGAADQLLSGEALAVTAGIAPMAGPSAEELTTLLDLVKQGNRSVSAAKQRVKDTTTLLAAHRLETQVLWQEVARYLRFSLGALPKAQRRELMRRYGFQFVSQPGSTTSEGSSQGSTDGDTTTGTGDTTGSGAGSDTGDTPSQDGGDVGTGGGQTGTNDGTEAQGGDASGDTRTATVPARTATVG